MEDATKKILQDRLDEEINELSRYQNTLSDMERDVDRYKVFVARSERIISSLKKDLGIN